MADKTNSPTTLQDVLHFWFEETEPKKWFAGDPELDTEIAKRFADLHRRTLADNDPPLTAGTPTLLATIIVFDQFSRNLFRGRSEAFAADGRALGLAKALVAEGLDLQMPHPWRMFAYLPFEHSENMADQEQAVRLYEALDRADNRGPLQFSLDYARRHREVVRRFGRFPGRNRALGRESTEQELAFLEESPAGF